MKIHDVISSLSNQLGRKEYRRPDPQKLEIYQTALLENQAALDYLKNERNLAEKTIKHFQLGFSREKNAIAIPIFKNKILIDFKYRILPPNDENRFMREVNSETWIFNEDGLEHARKTGKILLMEGEIDVMSAWQAGMKAVISPTSGKESYQSWIELLDNISRVYVCYDNDLPGQKGAYKLAERLGIDKSWEIQILQEEGLKDLNDYFKKYNLENFKKLVKEAKPFYTKQYISLGDVIEKLKTGQDAGLVFDLMPKNTFQDGWLTILSAKTNVGKTSMLLNLAKECAEKDIPVLIFPIERGPESSAKRYLQIKYNEETFAFWGESDWEKAKEEANVPLYFYNERNKLTDPEFLKTILEKAKKIFGIKVIFIDHLQYLFDRRMEDSNRAASIAVQNLKRIAEENEMIIFLVSQMRKIESPGSQHFKRPNIDDIFGSSAVKQDAEAVAILYTEKLQNNELGVEFVKNKGQLTHYVYEFNKTTGVLREKHEDGITDGTLPELSD